MGIFGSFGIGALHNPYLFGRDCVPTHPDILGLYWSENHPHRSILDTAVKFLNEYFSAMHDVIELHDGQIMNFIRDSVMVVFGTQKKLDDHQLLLVRCAVEMRKKLTKLNKK